jgi:small redox-active disulfide protein 2
MDAPMRKIQIAGTGCPKCVQLYERAEAAAQELGLSVKIEKVTDINTMTAMGVMVTPALLIDGKIKSSGRVPSKETIKGFLA